MGETLILVSEQAAGEFAVTNLSSSAKLVDADGAEVRLSLDVAMALLGRLGLEPMCRSREDLQRTPGIVLKATDQQWNELTRLARG
jgi:hypothetical protein